ncbi:carbon-nitrogen hydrolase family protein [Kaistia geumhonensis]|uniref:Amidohydrolase n=1 Tax=Kaistia geumhonensis TaxID=410839 RepID=A0ABU0M9H3_9HYPH|nr:carbon-nitrogen hydrolase family protein [Kaistia geumhonensis]MCX5477370.1 carbon-nitrogen hydrolase family protein [Kaistia geumhonensis]MDQ0517423.1 putative amidohydrolase [Kaistia geumhonensis]
MTSFKAACVQMNSGRSVEANVAAAEELIRAAAGAGASYVLTPEMTTILDRDKANLLAQIQPEEIDPSLQRFRELARELGIHLHIGSMAIRLPDEHIANRSFVIAPNGAIVGRYDKIHMFDVDLSGGESYRESATYRAGDTAVLADLPEAKLGLTICYDVRFPVLHRTLAKAGASVIAVPAAFTKKTGEAHWHVLLRARAIETGSYIVAAAQAGHHEDGRDTFGHSMIVDPWGKILAEAGDAPGTIIADIDPAFSLSARQAIPALLNQRDFALPEIPQVGSFAG